MTVKKAEKRKEQEIRLYFYNERKNRLTISNNAAKMSEGCRYRLNRPYIAKSYLKVDKDQMPVRDCFILGVVKETIKDDEYGNVDFVEPVCKVELDFLKYSNEPGFMVKDWDIISLEYNCNVRKLEEQLETLLQFMVKKDYENDTRLEYVKKYILKSKSTNNSSSEIVESFNTEIWNAFEEGNTAKLRKLFDVITGKNVY